jgi:uncharacterized membrane protein YeaQ/YmgE (transglycosylase-associated protein family)
MGLFVWFFAGLIVGWMSFTFWPKSTMGSMANFGVAALGGLAGGYLSTFLFPAVDNPLYNITGESFLTAILLALVFLLIFRFGSTYLQARRTKPLQIP